MGNACGNFFRFLILSLTVAALVLQFMTTASCDLVGLAASGTRKTMGVFYESNARGVCYGSSYTTDDPFIKSARSMLGISILAGGLGGFMVFIETVLFDFWCAGLLESLAYFLAWVCSALTFIFYGAEICQEDQYVQVEEFAETVYEERDVDFSGSGCEPTQSSHFMTAATVCYFVAAFFLCCAPQPETLWRQASKK